MADYYVLPTVEAAEQFGQEKINGSPMFPIIVGDYRMDRWFDSAKETVDGRGAIPRIPKKLLQFYNVDTAMVADMLVALVEAGGTIQNLDKSDFPTPEDEE